VFFQGVQEYDVALYRSIGRFLGGLYAAVGPAVHADTVMFLGRYRATPTGVHRDACSNFFFQLHGKKRIRWWPAEAFARHPGLAGATAYAHMLDGSEVAELEPGDVLYLPPDIHHVGEAGDEPSAHLSVVLSSETRDVVRVVEAAYSTLLASGLHGKTLTMTCPDHLPRPGHEARGLPPTIAHVIAAHRYADTHLEHATYHAWALRLGAMGFAKVPPRRPPEPLPDAARVCAVPGFPLVWRRFDREVLCAANGHAFVVHHTPAVMALLATLSRGRAHSVARVVATYGEGARAVLEALHEIWGIDRVPGDAIRDEHRGGGRVVTGA
jgi:hypothetical protein